MVDPTVIERLISAAGYDAGTPLAVGVSSPSTAPVLVAHGDGADARTLDCDGRAYAASLAKQITGACAALLAHDAVLDVEAPIARWLPELPPWSRTIHVRHLIHHTAGLPTTDAVWEQMTRAGETDWTSDGVIAALTEVPELEQRPGAIYTYSNVGYICLARIIERLAGADLNAFAQARIFEPLKMRTTLLWSGPAPQPPVVIPEQLLGSPAPLSVGDGGLWTSVSDLLRWNDALLTDQLGVTKTLHTTGALDDGTPLDYAWGVRVFRVDGNRVESHGGTWEGATAKLVRLPDQGASFAALAHDGSVDRMVALSSALQDVLIGGATR